MADLLGLCLPEVVQNGGFVRSAFKGNGKVGPLKKLDKNPRFHDAFMKLGEEWNLESYVKKQLEEYSCLM